MVPCRSTNANKAFEKPLLTRAETFPELLFVEFQAKHTIRHEFQAKGTIQQIRSKKSGAKVQFGIYELFRAGGGN